MAGISAVLQVCDTACSWQLPGAAHAGHMSQVLVHLAWAHPACAFLEYIPWIRECFTDPATVADGHCPLPELPGAGTTPSAEAWEYYRQPVS